MAKTKVQLAWIPNAAARRTTLKKRRKSLAKKVREIGVLCGVEACVVVYASEEREPVAWPSLEEARRMMVRFKGIPEVERGRKMVDQETFLRQRIAKLLEQRHQQQRENRELEMRALMLEGIRGRGLHDLSIEDASALSWMLEAKLKAICEKREEVAQRLAMVPPPSVVRAPVAAAGGMMLPPVERSNPIDPQGHQNQNWLVQMMSPWSETTQMFVDPLSPWQDTFLP